MHPGQEPLGLHLHLEHHHPHQVAALVRQPRVLGRRGGWRAELLTLGSGGTISAEGQKHLIFTSSMYLGQVHRLHLAPSGVDKVHS